LIFSASSSRIRRGYHVLPTTGDWL
jgi:hypothetical protein